MDRIEIKGYKSFKDLALDLLPINILIGSNGSVRTDREKATSCPSSNSLTVCTSRSSRNMWL